VIVRTHTTGYESEMTWDERKNMLQIGGFRA